MGSTYEASSTLAVVTGMNLITEADSSIGESICSSIDWCEGSVGSLVSIGDSDYSSTPSHFSSSASLCMEDWNQNQDLEEFKMEPTPLKSYIEACGIPTEARQTISAPCLVSPPVPLPNEQMEVVLDQVFDTPSSFTESMIARPKSFATITSCPDELLCLIFSYLTVDALVCVREVSKRFKSQGSRDEAGWSNHCTRLWSEKAHVCWRAIQLKMEHSSMIAYKTSFQDGIHREDITPNELCFDPVSGRGTIWHFRFKEAAGNAWTSFDPWHAGLDARKMVFFRDGTVRQLVSDDASNGSFRVEHPFFDAANLGDPAIRPNAPNIEMKWRFLLDPIDMPLRPRGSYVRLKVGGRDVPTYIVKRSPTGNWGFIMENCWGIFASFPLPRRHEVGRELPHRSTRMRLRRTSAGSVRWLNVDGMESDSEEETMDVDRQMFCYDGQLLEDHALPTTSRRQWREALLYNYGAVALPEGEAARDEFNRIFQSFRRPRR